jgi:hypothetical protein
MGSRVWCGVGNIFFVTQNLRFLVDSKSWITSNRTYERGFAGAVWSHDHGNGTRRNVQRNVVQDFLFFVIFYNAGSQMGDANHKICIKMLCCTIPICTQLCKVIRTSAL